MTDGTIALPACRRLAAHVFATGFAVAMAVSFVIGSAAPAAAQFVSCHSLDLQIAISPSEPPECFRGDSGDGDFKGGWEYMQMTAGDRFIAVSLQRAGMHSGFYRPRLETVVEDLFGDEIESIEWDATIDDERFDVRRFEVVVGGSQTLPCIGFVATGGQSMGSEVKSGLYGYICNIGGIAFAEGEVIDMLSRIEG